MRYAIVLVLAGLAVGCSSQSPVASTPVAASNATGGNASLHTLAVDGANLNCQPGTNVAQFAPDQLGKVTVTNSSSCTNDYTFIVWSLRGSERMNVAQMSRRLGPGETGVITVGLNEACGARYERDVYFGVAGVPGQNRFTFSDVANAVVYAPGATWDEASCGAVPQFSTECARIFPENGAIQLTDGTIWTINAAHETLRNGVQVNGGLATLMQLKGGDIYVQGALDGLWYVLANNIWVPTNALDACLMPPSPECTRITPGTGSIVTADGGLWTLTSAQETIRNGVHVGGGLTTILEVVTHGQIQGIGALDGLWYEYTNGMWLPTGAGDQCQGR